MDSGTAAKNLKDRTNWQRLVFMVLFALILNVVNTVLLVFVVVQFLFKAVTGKLFDNAQPFAGGLATYMYQIARFQTYASDILPWPFSPWPAGAPGADMGGAAVFGDEANEPRPRRRCPRPTGDSTDSAPV